LVSCVLVKRTTVMKHLERLRSISVVAQKRALKCDEVANQWTFALKAAEMAVRERAVK